MASKFHERIPIIIDSIVRYYKNKGVSRLKQKIKIDDPYSTKFISYKPDYVIERSPNSFTEYYIVFEIISDQDEDKTAHDLFKILGKKTIRKAIFISTSPEKKKETDKILNVHLGQLKKKFGIRTKKELQDISSLEVQKKDSDEKIRKIIYEEIISCLPKIKDDKCVFCGKEIEKSQIICNKCDNGEYNSLKSVLRKYIE
ncbi:MAG: hypothetical protein ACOC3Z_00390 [Nanoarchaeota archaeon]